MKILRVLLPVAIMCQCGIVPWECRAENTQIETECVDTGREDTTQQDSGFTPGAGAQQDSLIPGIRNPICAAGLSILFPGAGQFYNRRYVRGTLIALTELSMGLYAYNRYRTAEKHQWVIDSLKREARLSSAITFTAQPVLSEDLIVLRIDTLDLDYPRTGYLMQVDTSRYERDLVRNSCYHALSWASGCYLYAIMDAMEKTGYFQSDAPRNPVKAGWLSAVPGLGLGQLYNGSLSKAGIIWMTQVSLGYVAYNKHEMMRRCEAQLRALADPDSPEYYLANRKSEYGRIESYWKRARQNAFEDRNTFLWYSLFFYFYGIFDAVVDAHLSDFKTRMKLEPDLGSGNGLFAVALRLYY